ncbi:MULTISPECIES: UbiX family flavin prenyltransferase [Pandoraea]|jgi:4-hydroxy-3-polyprenylbenzoate decarboxylase|uniref:Flavin prenyltransferase UbiX n=2 Tax=Pandoraea TaxID=93217 RepID=A0A378YMT6_9BURK|nr:MULTISPECIES: UbiX family flavin prenyltransferase [Pandoraea]AHB75437.1 3-octaprenyl-4-hydroxybenzoate carboxy-lyase [Pandoraea pnomenusa]AHN76245.1 3-octaprenyl-4-hydroxybenzoate carboxy-lyase [Pandoraea pnomenusa]AIU27121.2 3-octaprenyl-4-hydroxybenzoate carboxy-lyase [Pandoraea pnomenusa]ANC44338.1 3-octaprenyl-4-hydroxybenzoate carboxy-lyase [Pandoraea pnomenusa]MBN9095593.1 UbiX family flavin prenyltransferase [Pandoraea pnomenusa]
MTVSTGASRAAHGGRPVRLIVAITGATGAIYGVRLLQRLRAMGGVETHLLVSGAGWLTLRHELGMDRADVQALADQYHSVREIGANIASGSFATAGMVVAPCSMKTLASVAHGLSDNLIARAADVTLKERRRLVLMVRETPFNLAHLRNMTAVTEMGGIVYPPLPAFYNRPESIDAMVDDTVDRIIDLFGVAPPVSTSWDGLGKDAEA